MDDVPVKVIPLLCLIRWTPVPLGWESVKLISGEIPDLSLIQSGLSFSLYGLERKRLLYTNLVEGIKH